MFRIFGLALLLGVRTAIETTSLMAQSATPICDTPLSANTPCSISLAKGQKSVVVVARVLLPPATTQAPNRILISSDACCVDSTAVTAESGGYFAIRWNSADPPKTPVHINVLALQPTGPVNGSIILTPPSAPETLQLTLSSTSLRRSHIWFRGEYVPASTRIRIVNLRRDSLGRNSPDRDTVVALNRSRCESIGFRFSPRLEGKATPDSGRAVWIGNTNFEGNCYVETRWKLGDAAGQQEMDVVLGGDNGIAARREQLRSYGRQGPRLAAGLGVFRSVVRNQDFLCTARTDHARCNMVEAFPKKVTIPHRDSGTEPFFALEFPLLSYRSGRGWQTQVLRHARLVAGTTFNNPEDNPFIGIAIFPIMRAASEEIPFQLSVGSTVNGHKGVYGGLSLDASGIVSSILKVLGAGV